MTTDSNGEGGSRNSGTISTGLLDTRYLESDCIVIATRVGTSRYSQSLTGRGFKFSENLVGNYKMQRNVQIVSLNHLANGSLVLHEFPSKKWQGLVDIDNTIFNFKSFPTIIQSLTKYLEQS